MKCKFHPRWAMRRKPRADCAVCRAMWVVKEMEDRGVILVEEC